MKMEVLTTKSAGKWKNALEQCGRYDFYHQSAYHVLAEQAGEGNARLFVYTEGDCIIALPLLLRPIDDLPGEVSGWTDATSVYGYAGPIGSREEIPGAIVANFQAALQQQLHEMQVVSLFSRLNTFFPQSALLAGLGECRTLKSTVSIDLAQPLEKQRAEYRKNHKEGVNKLRRGGLTCVQDRDGTHLEDFVRIYHETMRRVDAQQEYFFSIDYFKQLLESPEVNGSLFVCLQNGRAVCGGVFVECCGILQYHLGGTLDEALRLAPMKLLVDDVRVWATGERYKILHLGGGVTASPDDPLLHFKIGFSNRIHDFTTWRWILAPDAYRRLCEEKSRVNERAGVQCASAGFFPAYRCPTVPSIHPSTCEPAKTLVGTSCQLVPERR